MFVRFLLIHKLLRGGGEGGAGVCFLFPVLSGTDVGRAWKSPASKGRRNERTICTMGKGENKKKKLKTDFFVFLLNHFFYICWFPKIQIFMVNGSSHNLFKMHCA